MFKIGIKEKERGVIITPKNPVIILLKTFSEASLIKGYLGDISDQLTAFFDSVDAKCTFLDESYVKGGVIPGIKIILAKDEGSGTFSFVTQLTILEGEETIQEQREAGTSIYTLSELHQKGKIEIEI